MEIGKFPRIKRITSLLMEKKFLRFSFLKNFLFMTISWGQMTNYFRFKVFLILLWNVKSLNGKSLFYIFYGKIMKYLCSFPEFFKVFLELFNRVVFPLFSLTFSIETCLKLTLSKKKSNFSRLKNQKDFPPSGKFFPQEKLVKLFNLFPILHFYDP